MKKILVLFSLSLLLCSSIVAQRTIQGSVTDENGEPLIGATVQVKGTDVGVITDFNGDYNLTIPSGNNVLVISYIGFQPQEVTLGTSNVVDIVMVQDAVIIEDVVVVGYGQKKKEELVGQVEKISSEAIESVPLGTFDQVLQGQATGMLVLGGSGQPGTSAGAVTIRGSNTINGGGTPLYIIDGVRSTAREFSAINPNDIESVSVLKDASQTSIYGANGANGVILVTTKRGEVGRPQITYKGQYGITDFTQDQFEMMNSTEKLAIEEIAQRGPGWTFSRINPANEGLSEDVLTGYDQFLDSLRMINTNWRDVIIQQGRTQSHDLQVSGGNETVRYFASGGFFDQEGQIPESRLQRGTLRFNFDVNASDAVNFGISTNIGFSKRDFITTENAINTNNPFALAYLKNPYEQLFNADGSYQFGAVGRNHLEEIELNENSSNQFKGLGSVYLEVAFLNNFTARTQWGMDYRENTTKRFISPNSILGTTVTPGNAGQLNRGYGENMRYTGTTTLNWARRFGADEEHRVDVLVGNEIVKRVNETFSFVGFGPDPDIQTPAGLPGNDPNLIPTLGGGTTRKNLVSLFGNVNYSLQDKYFISGGLRRDGSSVFGENNKYGTFWNVGASWIISREAFLRGSDVVSYLKPFVNYGTSGSDLGIGDFQWLGAFNIVNYNSQPGIIPSTPRSNDLQWEVTEQFSAGVEYGFFNDRLKGAISIYQENVTELFINQQLSRSVGFNSLEINAGELRNRGVEVDISGDILRTKDFVWNLGIQAALNENEVTDLGQVSEFEVGTSIIREGLPLGTHFAVEWAGVDPATGDPLYYDLDGNLTTEFSADNSVAKFGTSNPKYNGSVTTSLQYKKFSLSALGIWVAERTLFNNQTFFQENPNFAQWNQLRSMNNIWREPGDVTNIQRVGAPRQFSSKDLEDGSFFRLRNVRLSYDFSDMVDDAVAGLRIYIIGTNILTITDFTGFDPEIANNIAQYEYPAQRSWSMGVDLTF